MLQRRLETDRELSAFAGQFVPLKIRTDGSGDWGRWSRQYPAVGNSIPIVYVIRADGKMLFGKSGSLPRRELPEMLFASLQQSGRILNDAEAELLSACVEQAEEGIANQNLHKTARALRTLAKIGTPGDLKSYSELAVRADEIFEEFHEAGENAIVAARKGLSDPENTFESVLTLVEADDVYKTFSKLKMSAGMGMREIERNSDLAPLGTQARALYRARRLAAASQPRVRKKAAGFYGKVISRFPGTEAAELARAELTQLDPKAAAALSSERETTAISASEPFRTWADTAGSLTAEARLTGRKKGWVRLETRDGKIVTIPVKKLSKPDREYLEMR